MKRFGCCLRLWNGCKETAEEGFAALGWISSGFHLPAFPPCSFENMNINAGIGIIGILGVLLEDLDWCLLVDKILIWLLKVERDELDEGWLDCLLFSFWT